LNLFRDGGKGGALQACAIAVRFFYNEETAIMR
jgi:hypothetical protein